MRLDLVKNQNQKTSNEASSSMVQKSEEEPKIYVVFLIPSRMNIMTKKVTNDQ